MYAGGAWARFAAGGDARTSYVVNLRSVENNAPCEQQCVALARDDRGNSAQIFERVDQLRLLHLQSRCRRGRGEPSPGADVAGVSPVPVQTW